MYQATVSFPIPRKKAFFGGSFPGSLATQKNDSLFQFFMFTYSSIIFLIIKNNIENIFVFTLYKTFNINIFFNVSVVHHSPMPIMGYIKSVEQECVRNVLWNKSSKESRGGMC